MSPAYRPYLPLRRVILLCALLVPLLASGCAGKRTTLMSPAFSVYQSQSTLPILPFNNILVPTPFAETVFNDFVDDLNDNREKAGFTTFAIIKEELGEVEKILSPAHIYLTGEVWSYLENSGCCATELRVSSRLRIYRVRSRELLWEAEIPLESFFEHDKSILAVEQEKLAKKLATEMARESRRALQGAKRIQID